MEANEPSEMISEIEEERHEEHAKDRFRNRAAIWIALLAALMAVRGLGGDKTKDEMIAKNIQASDAWSFYQAKNVRQNMYKLAADTVQDELSLPGVSADRKAVLEKRLAKYEDTVKRYESEPGGEGKEQLSEKAKDLVKERDHAELQVHAFDFAEMTFQLALVLASVSILGGSRRLLMGSMVLGAIGLILTLDGFFLWMPLG